MFATVREEAGTSECEMDAKDVGELLLLLGERYGGGFKRIVSRAGAEERTVVLVNGNNIRQMKGLATQLREGDEVAIFPPVSGG
jgi:molybdopterin synthase sulfur carrier subunit